VARTGGRLRACRGARAAAATAGGCARAAETCTVHTDQAGAAIGIDRATRIGRGARRAGAREARTVEANLTGRAVGVPGALPRRRRTSGECSPWTAEQHRRAEDAAREHAQRLPPRRGLGERLGCPVERGRLHRATL